MALPLLPSLPSLSSRPELHPSGRMLVAPGGDGWGFTPDGGWGIDFSGVGFNGSGFVGSSSTGGGSGSGGGLNTGWDIGTIAGGIAGGIIGGPGGVPGGIVGGQNAQQQATGLLGAINWGRIGAFLLGLLLIAGGLYLIKPIQQAVNVTVGHAGRALAETSEAA